MELIKISIYANFFLIHAMHITAGSWCVKSAENWLFNVYANN